MPSLPGKEERRMNLMNLEGKRVGVWLGVLSMAVCLALGSMAGAQVGTTTVQGTVYLANGQPGSGTLVLSWPSFTTASGQLVVAGSTTVTIAPDGFLSVNLAPNQGSTPAGQYYTAVYYLSDGSSSTQYWVVPEAPQATLGQVQSQLMPSVQAVQTVSKAYVDQAIQSLAGGTLTISGTTMTGPLILCCDPTQPLQAADKHYVDENVALDLPLTGGTLTGPVTATKLGALNQVDQLTGADFGAKLSACLSGLSATNGGICDARNFTGTQAMGSSVTISTANATVLLPCATIATANQIIVAAGTRNVSLRGCSLRGPSTASGSQGGTVFLYSGSGAMVQVGDPTYATDTMGFHLDNVAINTTASTSATAQGFVAYRTQELDLESLYFLGNTNQTGMTLDGTGNYTGGTFVDNAFNGFQTAVDAIGHQISNPATTDWLNASTFMRLHIDCPTSGSSPISGTYGINLQQGDGNTFNGGDVEGCSTALHLGANAQNNTIVGLRNENSTNQVVADTGSSYNLWETGGTMFTGALTDAGTRNSFIDTFHRSFNGLNGDWYGSQKDATVTNHYRLGIGAGNERGLQERYQTDYGYRWTMGLSDAAAGEQFYQILDELNNVYRVSIGQYNNGQSSTNNQTVINAAGTGAVVLNGSNNAGTGGVVFGSGGTSEATVATVSNSGNAQFNGSLQVGGVSTFIGSTTVKNQADAEIDATLWAGLTTGQKESFIYKDWNGSSQWYMEKDTGNNWALNSAVGALDSFKAYQSNTTGDTYINTSNSTGSIRMNYEPGSSSSTVIYAGGATTIAAFTGATSIKFPGLSSSSGHSCLQIDNSGFITNTGTACGTGSGSGTVSTGTAGQIAFYSSAGTTLSGITAIPVVSGGTGASTATGALANLGAAALAGASFTGPVSVASTFSAANNTSIGPRYDVTNPAFGAKGDGSTDDTAAIQSAFNACWNNGATPHGGIVEFPGNHSFVVSSTINAYDGCQIEGTVGGVAGGYSPPELQWNGSVPGAVYNVTGVTIAANSTPVYGPSSPAPFPMPYIATFTASNSLVAGQWVDVEGLSTAGGKGLNRGVLQVISATGTSFTAAVPFGVTTGTYTDTGTATSANIFIAFDANARYEQAVSNIGLGNKSANQANTFQVGIYYGSRVDTGTRVWHGEVAGATEYNYYFSAGGINVDFDKGWRSDSAGIAGIYWRVGSSDSFGIANGTVDNNRSSYGATSSGAAVLLDNQATCGNVHFTSRNMKIEVNSPITTGLGAFTLDDCPSSGNGVQFFLSFDTTWVVPSSQSTAGFNYPSIVMSPANDKALVLNATNSQFGSGTGANTTVAFIGIPGLSRSNQLGSTGIIPLLTYAPPLNSSGTQPAASESPVQIMGDLNIGQLWQNGIQASDFLYSDTAYAALPNGTTLYAGQIVAPPNYWNGANGKRYALDVVYQAGTTGTPNGGATTCSGNSGSFVVTCTSATDLSSGQRISIGTDTGKQINYVDATNASAVLVNLVSALGATHTNQALSFTSPVLGPEIQLPTKSTGAPTVLAWSQGDMEENAGATANGVAAWVNVSAGTPGTWAGVPLGNSSGILSTAQTNWAAQTGCSTSGYVWSPQSGTCVANGSGGGSGTVNSGTTNQIAYYAANGTAVSGQNVVAVGQGGTGASSTSQNYIFAGPTSGSGAPSFRVLVSGDIPSNAANTTGTAAGFTGSLAGDVTGTQSATTVGKVNGGSIPASANSLSTNASSQMVASTTHNLSVPANCIAASGSGTAYTCTTSPTFTPAAGDHLQFRADVANTGSATLAVNGVAAATIKKWGGSGGLIANDLLAGHWISATFDGTYWQLEGQLGNANATEINGTTISGLSGSGSTLALTTSPVFTTPTLGAASATSVTTTAASTFAGSANTFKNSAAAENDVIVQAGTGAAQNAAVELSTYAGTAEWKLKMDTSNYYRLNDVVNSLDREVFYQNGQTMINSGAGTNAVVINNTSGSGTGGLIVYEGGSNNTIAALNVSGTGSATFAGAVTAPSFVGAVTGNASTATSAASLSASSALPSGTTATTPAAGDNSTKLATTASLQYETATPHWLQFLGTGADGASTPITGNLSGDYYYTSFTLNSGVTLTVNSSYGLVIHATGACTINGTISTGSSANNYPSGGGSGGGGGYGTANGAAAPSVYFFPSTSSSLAVGGGAGGTSGVGGAGNTPTNTVSRSILGAGTTDGIFWGGSTGGAGGSSGGAGGNGAGSVVLICGSITGTTGIINAVGNNGTAATTGNEGGGGGGGGGVIILSSQQTETFSGITLSVAGGSGGAGFGTGGAGGAGGSGMIAKYSGW